jgi:hypothetical protein
VCSCDDMGNSMTEPSGYMPEPLREGPDLTLYRGWQHGKNTPVPAVALAVEQPSPQSLRRLEHEYLLTTDLDAEWVAGGRELQQNKSPAF